MLSSLHCTSGCADIHHHQLQPLQTLVMLSKSRWVELDYRLTLIIKLDFLQSKLGFTWFAKPGQSVLQTPALLTQTPNDCRGPSGLRAWETPSAAPLNAVLIAQQQNIPRARLLRLSATIVSKNIKPFILTNCLAFIWTKVPGSRRRRFAGLAAERLSAEGSLKQRNGPRRWDTVCECT